MEWPRAHEPITHQSGAAKALTDSADAFRKENPAFSGAIPADAITTSASGLDPHVSPDTAFAQCDRAKARNVPVEQVRSLVQSHIVKAASSAFWEEPRVNVAAEPGSR
jgi:K+-transporting ATPase ATPase C chain